MIEADQSHLIIGVIILVALFIVLFYLIGVNVHKTKKIRLQVQKEIEIIFPNIMAALQQFEQLSNFKNGYFNNFKLQLWKSRFVPIMLKLEQIPYHKLKSDQKKLKK